MSRAVRDRICWITAVGVESCAVHGSHVIVVGESTRDPDHVEVHKFTLNKN